jgi:hypothetical protein
MAPSNFVFALLHDENQTNVTPNEIKTQPWEKKRAYTAVIYTAMTSLRLTSQKNTGM